MLPVKIAVVDDHTLFREGVANLLREEEHIRVHFTACNGEEMQARINPNDLPDIVLMDINMPVMDGYSATGWLRSNYPAVRVLALSMYEEDAHIIRMLRQGAGGYVLKECKTSELLAAIQSIHHSGFFFNDLVSGRLISRLQQEADPARQPVRLSERERRFLELCCSELTYKEIADTMSVSPSTVNNYREELFARLNIRSRVGLVLFAVKNKIAAF